MLRLENQIELDHGAARLGRGWVWSQETGSR
jgi:hypothetical protein